MLAVSDSNDLLGRARHRPESFGSPATIGQVFLTDYLLAFEAISLVLLVGAIAGVVLGRGRPAAERPARCATATSRASSEANGERYDLRRELQRRERDEQEHESEVGA